MRLRSTAALASAPAANPRAHWPADVQRDFEANFHSGVVGTVLVSETDRVRVWRIHIPVGTRCPFHRHVLDYFFTALNDGRQRVYYDDGRIVENEQRAGETQHFTLPAGEYFVHCVENIGDTDLNYMTVEFLDSANPPLAVPDSVRRKLPGRP
jgi:hypothetical protein